MEKDNSAYYLSVVNIAYLKKKSEADGRSASSYLDRLLDSLRDADFAYRQQQGK